MGRVWAALSRLPYAMKLRLRRSELGWKLLARLARRVRSFTGEYVAVANGPLTGLHVAVNHVNHLEMALGIYEPHVTRCMVDEIRPGDVCWDVGSFYGYYALVMAKRAGMKVTMYLDDRFSGTNMVATADTGWLGSFNDQISSMVVSATDTSACSAIDTFKVTATEQGFGSGPGGGPGGPRPTA